MTRVLIVTLARHAAGGREEKKRGHRQCRVRQEATEGSPPRQATRRQWRAQVLRARGHSCVCDEAQASLVQITPRGRYRLSVSLAPSTLGLGIPKVPEFSSLCVLKN